MMRRTSKPRKPFISSLFGTCVPEKAFFCCIKDSVFIEPTCGAGEFLLATLERKFELWERSHSAANKEEIECIVGTFYGNDINGDSVIISKLRLFLCVAHRG